MTVLDSMGIEFNMTDRNYKSMRLDELVIDRHDKSKIYWIHINLDQQNLFKKLAEKLLLPEDIITLCTEEDTMPKFVDTSESLTIRVQCLQSTALQGKEEVNYGNLIMHLTSHYCLTVAGGPLPALISFIENYPKALQYAKTPCFILFLMLDDVINDYSKILYEFELVTDKIDLSIRTSRRNLYNEVMYIKNQVMKAERYAAAIRHILMRISGRKIAVISEQCRLSLGNLFDHSQMVVGQADSVREILNGMLDQIDNALMQKMSESMKILTAFAAIFLPLTLIAGIYGMNFHWIPELNWKYGYFWALSLMFLCGGILFLIFRKKKWF